MEITLTKSADFDAIIAQESRQDSQALADEAASLEGGLMVARGWTCLDKQVNA